MQKNQIKKHISLPIRKKHVLTFILILFGIGSYTYSEITEHPKKLNIKTISLLSSIKLDTPIYYVTPTNNIKKVAESKKIITPPSESVMHDGIINLSTFARFLKTNNRNVEISFAYELAGLYVTEAKKEGVNPDLAFTQMCLETGFLRFDGTVDKGQNNFCGLGVTGNGVKGLSFSSTKEGVRAHIQHLKAYGSTHELNNDLVDSRFKLVKRGSGTKLSDLTGKWATDKKYDKKIRYLLNRLFELSKKSETDNL